MTITYAPRVAVHPDRYGSLRPLPPRLVVVHTTEGSEGEGSAEQLAAFLTRPGDRTTASGSRYGSSYHAVADTGQRVIPAVLDNRVAYSAPGANTDGLHIVIPGKAGQTLGEWMAGSSRPAITTVAAYIWDMQDRYGIPARRLSVAQIRAGASGYCDHAAIAAAYGKTTHWDVGPNFPWAVLANDIATLGQPEPPPQVSPPSLQGVPDVFFPIQPLRNSNTRLYGGTGIDPGEYRFGLHASIPANATAVALNVTAISLTDIGFVTVWPGGGRPDASVLNFVGNGQAHNGAIVVGVTDSAFSIYTSAVAHLIVDVTGYWTAS